MFYLITVTTSAGTPAPAIFAHEDSDQAKSVYHQTLASAMANANVDTAMAMVVNDGGYELPGYHEFWTRAAEPTPEPEG